MALPPAGMQLSERQMPLFFASFVCLARKNKLHPRLLESTKYDLITGVIVGQRSCLAEKCVGFYMNGIWAHIGGNVRPRQASL